MFITTLTLENFRNYVKQSVEFSSGINIISGRNAQGKTNCAEAIFYLCTGYSPRAAQDKQVVRFGCTEGRVSGSAKTAYGDVSVEIRFFEADKKRVKVNGVEILKMGELMGNINAVFFNPDELKLIKESPEDRRRFLDISLSQMDRKYFYALSRYRKILAQRNKLLKDDDKALIRETLPIWDEQLSACGAIIIKARHGFVELLSPFAGDAHSFLTSGEEKLEVLKASSYEGSVEEIAGAFKSDLISGLDKDIALGYTTVGPHRDDLKLKINGKEVRSFGSQGQQRTAALSLKLAETEIFKRKFGEYPLLILDDALSELDISRRRKLIELIDGIQTIITLTEEDEVLSSIVGARHMVASSGVITVSE